MCSCTQKSLYVTIYSSIIPNSKKKQPKYLGTDQVLTIFTHPFSPMKTQGSKNT